MHLSELLQRFEAGLNDCLTQKTTSFEECLEQQEKTKVGEINLNFVCLLWIFLRTHLQGHFSAFCFPKTLIDSSSMTFEWTLYFNDKHQVCQPGLLNLIFVDEVHLG